LESYITNDFEGKTAHQMTQYIRGHLFVFLDSILGITYRGTEIDEEEWQNLNQHPFEHSEVQKLFRTYLRFTTAFFLKLNTLGQSVSSTCCITIDPIHAVCRFPSYKPCPSFSSLTLNAQS